MRTKCSCSWKKVDADDDKDDVGDVDDIDDDDAEKTHRWEGPDAVVVKGQKGEKPQSGQVENLIMVMIMVIIMMTMVVMAYQYIIIWWVLVTNVQVEVLLGANADSCSRGERWDLYFLYFKRQLEE